MDDLHNIRRRDAIKLLGAGLALAKTGCFERPREEIVPWAQRPPELSPSDTELYATSMVIDGFATGLIAKSYAGRPIKIEGNPAHPSSRGATSAIHQASVLDLYDPGRAKAFEFRGVPSSWDRFVERLATLPQRGLWLVMPPQSSPLIAELLARIRRRFPELRVVFDDPLGRRRVYEGAALAYGTPLETQIDFSRTEIVLALDADFLAAMPMSVRWARDFAGVRRVSSPAGTPARLYAAEPMMTPTGTLADHRAAVPAGDVAALAIAVAAELGKLPDRSSEVARARSIADSLGQQAWVTACARDLSRAVGRSAVVVGDRQPTACHALAHWLNATLGNLGETVTLTAPALIRDLGEASLAELAEAMRSGDASAVVILEANPVYTAPSLELDDLLRSLPLSVHYTMRADETSMACGWLAPASHYLETWGDARAYDGTRSLIQPLIRPLYATPAPVELLAAIAGERDPSAYRMLRESWRPAGGEGTAGPWRAALSSGVVDRSASPVATANARTPDRALLASLVEPRSSELALDLVASSAVHDGRFAANAWLQEMPHPITKLTWGNAALVAAATADRLGVTSGDVLRLRAGSRAIAIPALIVPGHAPGSVTVELGYGRRAPGERVGRGASGFTLMREPGQLLTSDLAAKATGAREALARTQHELATQGRELALQADLAAYRAEPDVFAEHRGSQLTLLPQRDLSAPQWAMTIDTTICTGCSSCVVACQAENNVPSVGREGVLDGRDMHWLRIDTYVSGPDAAPDFVHQPMLCQHCEHAPCEYVCPVFATAHSPDGLNEMVYNRCVGTRFCSNNCPYKVRRFNWFDYTSDESSLELARNPDVTVRARGVMEKCTYCVQRIRGAEIRARIEDRDIAPGEVVTACQQACPTGAIQFGALAHAGTPMVEWRREPRLYSALHELGTRPRTQYLAKIWNRTGHGG